MIYYHCSPIEGLTNLTPGKPQNFEKPSYVYMTTSLPMALMYGVRNFEYTYGYTKDGKIYYEEYFPNALRKLYSGRTASLYFCMPETIERTEIPNEVVSQKVVSVIKETVIPDVYEALLEQERTGALVIRRYEELSQKMLDWICKAEAEEIRKRNLIQTACPMAEYMKRNYPKSWALVEEG